MRLCPRCLCPFGTILNCIKTAAIVSHSTVAWFLNSYRSVVAICCATVFVAVNCKISRNSSKFGMQPLSFFGHLAHFGRSKNYYIPVVASWPIFVTVLRQNWWTRCTNGTCWMIGRVSIFLNIHAADQIKQGAEKRTNKRKLPGYTTWNKYFQTTRSTVVSSSSASS